MVHLSELIEKFSERVEFLLIYTGEETMARAGGGRIHDLPEALRDFAEPPGSQPGSRLRLEERVRAGKTHFRLPLPLLIDNEKCDVQMLYGAFPKRLVVVDTEGCIALDSGRAATEPFPWKEVIDWLAGHCKPVSPPDRQQHG